MKGFICCLHYDDAVMPQLALAIGDMEGIVGNHGGGNLGAEYSELSFNLEWVFEAFLTVISLDHCCLKVWLCSRTSL